MASQELPVPSYTFSMSHRCLMESCLETGCRLPGSIVHKKKNILKYRQTRRKLLQAVFWFLPFGCIVGAFLFWNSIELGCEILPFHLLFLITSFLWLYSSYCWNGAISLNAIYLCKRDGWACSFWQSHDPRASMRAFAYDTKETPLAACENLNEDEMPEHLAEMGISAEDSYQESA